MDAMPRGQLRERDGDFRRETRRVVTEVNLNPTDVPRGKRYFMVSWGREGIYSNSPDFTGSLSILGAISLSYYQNNSPDFSNNLKI